MFKLYFQFKRNARKKKEAGEAIGSLGIKERRKEEKKPRWTQRVNLRLDEFPRTF